MLKISKSNVNSKIKKEKKKKEKYILNTAEDLLKIPNDTFYKDNVDKIMPHLEMELHLVTTEGIDYFEKIVCVSKKRIKK